MLIVQCSSVDLLEILATHVQRRFAQANGGSTNTTRAHANFYLDRELNPDKITARRNYSHD